MIAIVDYGMGNLGSVANALSRLGAEYRVTNKSADLADADGIILPGVGAFHAAMDNIRALGLDEQLTAQVVDAGKPFLGICLGMQLIAQDSTELGFTQGLGWIDGHVVRMEPDESVPVPHVGWNEVNLTSDSPVLERLPDGSHFYFDHGYHLQCDPDIVVARCEYGGRWVAAIQQDNIFAVQFHPEKSQRNGLRLLRNFLNAVESGTASAPC